MREIKDFKIVQNGDDTFPFIIAICNDGEMFSSQYDAKNGVFLKWEIMPVIPQKSRIQLEVEARAHE